MRQRNEGLPQTALRDPDIVLHHRIVTGKAVLVPQPFKDALGRVPLLHRRCQSCVQDHIDHRQQRTQLRLRHQLRARVARRHGEPAHLANRLTAQAKYPRRFSKAVPFDQHKTSDGSIDFHGKPPGHPPKGNSLTTGRTLHRRDDPIAAATWSGLSQPCTHTP